MAAVPPLALGMLQQHAVPALDASRDVQLDGNVVHGAKKNSKFTRQLHTCGMFQDSSMEAMTRLKTRDKVERQRRERTIHRINSNFDSNFNYIKSLQMKLAKRQNKMATNIVDIYSALTIQLCFRSYSARRALKCLKALKFLSVWFYHAYMRQSCRRKINIIKRSIKHYLFRTKIDRLFCQKRAARILTCHVKKVMMMRKAKRIVSTKHVAQPTAMHILLMGTSRARHVLVERQRSDRGRAMHLISRLVNNYKRYKRNVMLHSERGTVVFFILSKLCQTGCWMNNPSYIDKHSEFVGGNTFVTAIARTDGANPSKKRPHVLSSDVPPYLTITDDTEAASSSSATLGTSSKRSSTIRSPASPRQSSQTPGFPTPAFPSEKRAACQRPVEVPHGLDRDIYHFIRSKLIDKLVLVTAHHHALDLQQKQRKLRKQIQESSAAEVITRLLSVPIEIPLLPDHTKDLINADKVILASNNTAVVKNPKYRPPPPPQQQQLTWGSTDPHRGSTSTRKSSVAAAASKTPGSVPATAVPRRFKRVLAFSDNNLPHMPAELEGHWRLTSFLDVAQFVIDLVRAGSRDPLLFLSDIPDLLYEEQEVAEPPRSQAPPKRKFNRKGSIYHPVGSKRAVANAIYNPNNDPKIAAMNEAAKMKAQAETAKRQEEALGLLIEREETQAETASQIPFSSAGAGHTEEEEEEEEEDVVASLALAASSQPRPPVRQRDPLSGPSPRYRPALEPFREERSYVHRQLS